MAFLKSTAEKVAFFLAGGESTSLLILDDSFPNLLSSPRIAEFNDYLDQFPNAIVRSTFAIRWPGKTRAGASARYNKLFPRLAKRYGEWHPSAVIAADLAYCVFLNNAVLFADYLERRKIPFIFTLYPGGGFNLNDPLSDQRLQRVCNSPQLRRVIVTQSITKDYLLEKGFLEPQRIAYIPGVVVPHFDPFSEPLTTSVPQNGRRHICFVANKYTPRGEDKGYDLFIEVAKRLAGRVPDVDFHVVGDWSPQDLDVSALAGRIQFHGTQDMSFYPDFYRGMTMIIAPNRHNVLAPGAFDSFPTSACVEAGMAGVAVVCTDPLNLNQWFEDGLDIAVVPSQPGNITAVVEELLRNESKLTDLRRRGQQKLLQLFDLNSQMALRLQVLQYELRRCVAEFAMQPPG
jgi:glycosyltransferase involved in cell wall biosynthesis